jgi:MoxR-like ATPase
MNEGLSHIRSTLLDIETKIGETIIGQSDLIRKLVITFFARGHVLIEWVPWLGKTKSVSTLAEVLGYEFKRISFTPDLLPTDLTGNEIYRPQTGKFEVRKWPIFTSLLLADEINRTPPKVQSALLEAMEEWQVTIGNETFLLPSPFFVIATENPLEHEGTYPLPEAELDRFMMKIVLDYPSKEDEKKILSAQDAPQSRKKSEEKISPKELAEMQAYLEKNIHIESPIYDYISDLLGATRDHLHLEHGASTRAGLALRDGARIVALLEWREYVTPSDVKYLAHDILRHRIGRSYEAQANKISTEDIIAEILESVRVP